MRSRVHSLWLLVDHCVLRNWDRILVRAVKGLISRAGMVSICPLLWQRDVKLQQTNKQTVVMPQWPFWYSKWLPVAKLINQCYYCSSYWVDWPRKHWYSYQNQVSTSFIDKVIDKTNYCPNTVIVKFKMAAHAKINNPMLSLLLLLGSLTQKT